MDEARQNGHWEDGLRKPINWILAFLLVLAAGAGLVSRMGAAGPLTLSSDLVARVAFLLAVGAAAARLKMDLTSVLRRLHIIDEVREQASQLLKKVEFIESEMIRVSEAVVLDQVVRPFFDEIDPQTKEEEPARAAYAATGRLYSGEYLRALANTYATWREIGRRVEIENPSVVTDFLRHLIRGLNVEEGCGPWVWMGTSRVVRPVAWEKRQDAVFHFAQEIHAAIKRGGLSVHRLYVMEAEANGEAESRTSKEQLRDLYFSHLQQEEKEGVGIRLSFNRTNLSDLSIIWRPSRRRNANSSDFSPRPEHTWEEITRNGWEVAFGLEWSILESIVVEKVSLIPASDSWIVWSHEQLRRLWVDGTTPKSLGEDLIGGSLDGSKVGAESVVQLSDGVGGKISVPGAVHQGKPGEGGRPM